MKKIFIEVKGGVVTGVLTDIDTNLDVIVVDYDNDDKPILQVREDFIKENTTHYIY
ncbi:MAG: hypothetical protein AABY32_01580 [Nanoarchaeota archaeon]